MRRASEIEQEITVGIGEHAGVDRPLEQVIELLRNINRD